MDIIETNRNADFEWATRLNRLVLNIIGIWPSAHKNAYDKFLSNLHVTFVIVIIFFVGAIPTIHSLVRTWGDLISMIDNLQFSLPLTMSVIKLIDIWWKKTDLLMAINMIAEDWIKDKTNKERCIMIKQAQNARIITMVAYSFMFVGSIFVIILPCFGKSIRYITNITDPVKILPLQAHYIYDKNQSPYFEITFVAQSFVILICIASYTGVDNLLGLLVFHLCGQLEILKEKLIKIKLFKNYNEGIALIVKEHIRLIKCFRIIESTYTLLLLGLLMYFGIIFCLYGFLILAILIEGKGMSMIRFIYLVSIALNVCIHMCLFCAVGEILVTKCEALHQAAYKHKWYKLEPAKTKNLLLIMIRAKKPLYITAGKMFPMTMSMFCNVIKTSAGYVSVLFAMQK
ncbi:odorant receptor 49b-like [Solenopsis invicta]|uniref:odorant receptor 49b-like n=1 Tax=Solenopsis invicta TaxID=13686 RepID=UPI00193E0CE3|nr:odorant receptor 49b-like [Solenopsis invicta]XP_039307323.1 odorant receptor 49b-like [Solenopsis invicta]XP_039307324.1 odorant receptor 49b-like [Solenopsis invicta]XP_039307325.1 odorant receptor 49b-like [Solenopsis invicta]